MKEEESKFEYCYSAPTKDERREIEGIRKKYLPLDPVDKKIKELKKLDFKAQLPARIVGLSLALAGMILLGSGAALILLSEPNIINLSEIIPGAILVVLGVLLIGIDFPLYQFIFRKRKEKYAEQILKLSEELLSKSEEKDKETPEKETEDQK